MLIYTGLRDTPRITVIAVRVLYNTYIHVRERGARRDLHHLKQIINGIIIPAAPLCPPVAHPFVGARSVYLFIFVHVCERPLIIKIIKLLCFFFWFLSFSPYNVRRPCVVYK